MQKLSSSIYAIHVDLIVQRRQECGILKWTMKVLAEPSWESCGYIVNINDEKAAMKMCATAISAHCGPWSEVAVGALLAVLVLVPGTSGLPCPG